MHILSPSRRTRLLLLPVGCYGPTTATAAAGAQSWPRQGLALQTELVNMKKYAYKYLFGTDLSERDKWFQNFKKAESSLTSPMFFRSTPTTGGKKSFSVGISIILPTFQPIGSSICRNSGRPSHVFNVSLFQAWAEKCHFSPLLNQKLATPMCQLFTTLCPLPLGS